jgi:O-antigen ligase
MNVLAEGRPASRFLQWSVFLYTASVLLVTPIPGLSPLTYVFLGAVLLSVLVIAARGRLVVPMDRVLLLPIAFTIWALLSMFWAPDFATASTRLISLALSVAAFALIWIGFANGLSYRPLLFGLITGAAVNASVALFQAQTEGVRRVAGLAENENVFGMQVGMLGLLWLAQVNRRKRWPLLVSLVLIAAATILSGSRRVVFVWVGLLMLLAQEVWLSMRRSWGAFGVAMLALPALAIGLAVEWSTITSMVQDLYVYQRFIFILEGVDISSDERLGMIQDGMRLWWQAPIWGHGIDQFRILTTWNTYSHNNYIELLSTLGVVGIVLYYAVHVVILRQAQRRSTSCSLVVILLLTIAAWDLAAVSFALRSQWLFLNAIAYLAVYPAPAAAAATVPGPAQRPLWSARLNKSGATCT